VTGNPAIEDDARNAGAEWEDAEVVVEGNLISSRKPDDLPAFMREMIEVAARAPVPT
jgi:protease I